MNNKNPWRDMGRQTLGKVRHGPKDQVGMDRVYRSEVRKITGEYSKKKKREKQLHIALCVCVWWGDGKRVS